MLQYCSFGTLRGEGHSEGRATARGGPGRRCDCCIREGFSLCVCVRGREGEGHGKQGDIEGERGREGGRKGGNMKAKVQKTAKRNLESRLSLVGVKRLPIDTKALSEIRKVRFVVFHERNFLRTAWRWVALRSTSYVGLGRSRAGRKRSRPHSLSAGD